MDTLQVQFVPRSKWIKNRSKFQTFATIQEGSVQHPGLAIDLTFLLLNSPVPVSTLRWSLYWWKSWKYLYFSDDGYHLEKKGLLFIQHMEAKYSFMTDSWYADMSTWRSISRDACRTPDGQLLPRSKFIKTVEALKLHRQGSPRPRAGRPALSNHCPVCHCSYRLEIKECPVCRDRAARAARAASTTMSVPPSKLQQPEAVSVPMPRCPRCHKVLGMGIHQWYCQSCDISYDGAWQPSKGKR
jgi:hypothetical protein